MACNRIAYGQEMPVRGSFAAPLPILRQIFLCIVDGHRAVRYGGDHLPQRFGAHVARGEHTGETGSGGFVRDDVAGLVQCQLCLLYTSPCKAYPQIFQTASGKSLCNIPLSTDS